MDVTPAFALEVVKTVGLPLAICLGMLYALTRWIVRLDDKLEAKELAHKAERKEDRDAHLALLREQTQAETAARLTLSQQIDRNTEVLNTVGGNVRDLVTMRKAAGG